MGVHAGSIPGSAQWVKDLVLPLLWCKPAAVVLIRPIDWELPYATGDALKRKKKKEQRSLVNDLSAFQCIGKRERLGSLKLFLRYAS